MAEETFYGWVGTCSRCGERWFVHTQVTYCNGQVRDWVLGAGSRDHTVCVSPPCYTAVLPGRYQPLDRLEDQLPFVAAYKVGGEMAVWQMLGVE